MKMTVLPGALQPGDKFYDGAVVRDVQYVIPSPVDALVDDSWRGVDRHYRVRVSGVLPVQVREFREHELIPIWRPE